MSASTVVPTRTVRAGRDLYHVSRQQFRGAALHFGCHSNRFDDAAGKFGVLYLGFDLATALMESAFHDHSWSRSGRRITVAEINSRMVRMLAAVEDLTLADLGAPGVMAADLGLNLSQLVSRDYRQTQRLARTWDVAFDDVLALPERSFDVDWSLSCEMAGTTNGYCADTLTEAWECLGATGAMAAVPGNSGSISMGSVTLYVTWFTSKGIDQGDSHIDPAMVSRRTELFEQIFEAEKANRFPRPAECDETL